MTRRIFAPILLSFTILFCACSRPDKTNEKNATVGGPPVPGDWAIVRFETEADTLNPYTRATDPASRVIGGPNNSNVYESLLYTDPRDYSTIQGRLAVARPEISQDHLTYTFTIRDGVKWHDGKAFTPEDVLFSFKAVMNPSVDAAALRGDLGEVINVELVEGRKIRMTMRKPYFLNEVVLGEYVMIIPKHIFDPQGVLDAYAFPDIIAPKAKTDAKLRQFGDEFNKHPNNRSPIGTGPFKFDKWDAGKEIVIARNDDYWGQKAYLSKVVYRIITDNTAALTALKAGEIDFNPRLQPIQYAQQTSGPAFDQQFVKATFALPIYYYIAWNEERPFFKDKRVRQAMTMLIDRDQIIQTLLFGLGQPAAAPFFYGSADLNTNIKPLPYDPKRAAELLDQAGWIDHDGDGIRDKDGIPFRVELLGSASSAPTGQLMPIVKESLRKAGIDTTEKRIEFTVFTNSMRDHKFDAAFSAWIGDLTMDPYQIWHSNSIANRGSNFISFRNPESDQLIEQARVEFDTEKRKQLYWKWQELIHEEQPYTFLYYSVQAAAYVKRFQNVHMMPIRPGYDLTQWFVPKSMQKYTDANVQ
jgi:peptide/nickel transport system substrate-binding protein